MKRAGARAVFKKSGRQQPSTLFPPLRIWAFLPHPLAEKRLPHRAASFLQPCSPTQRKIPGPFGPGILHPYRLGSAEVTLQQALESLAVTGLVAGHLISYFAPLVTSILVIPID